jgi:pimeloyl-ACP methyl ester carboxylesterase
MLFMHGITPGWAMYMHFVEALAGNRTVILIDLDAIKLESLTFRMPIPNSFCVDVMDILHRHQIAKVSVVGHSFGSITSGWLVNRYPSVVSHLTLVDPVSLLLALPDVAFKFLYR